MNYLIALIICKQRRQFDRLRCYSTQKKLAYDINFWPDRCFFRLNRLQITGHFIISKFSALLIKKNICNILKVLYKDNSLNIMCKLGILHMKKSRPLILQKNNTLFLLTALYFQFWHTCMPFVLTIASIENLALLTCLNIQIGEICKSD